MNLKNYVGRKVRVSLEIGGGCRFGKIISVEPGLFGEEQVVLVEVDGFLRAVSPEAVTPLEKDMRHDRR